MTEKLRKKLNRRRAIMRIVAIIGGVWLGLCGLLYFLQGKLLYHPTRTLDATPEDWGLSYEDVFFASTDDVKLHGWYVPSIRSRFTVLFCHGNAGSISHRYATIRNLHELGLNVFIFDYRGFGQSEGSPTEKGTYRDAEGALFWLESEKRVAGGDVVIMGRSLGGGVASWLADRHPPRGLILESTFTSIPDVGAELYPFLPVRLLSRFRYASIERVGSIEAPKLIIHSRDDDLIPYSHGVALFEAAREPKEFLSIRGAHNSGFLDSEDEYKRALEAFFDKL